MQIAIGEKEFAPIFRGEIRRHRLFQFFQGADNSARRGAEGFLRNHVHLRRARRSPADAQAAINAGVQVIDDEIVTPAREVDLRVKSNVADQTGNEQGGLPVDEQRRPIVGAAGKNIFAIDGREQMPADARDRAIILGRGVKADERLADHRRANNAG